MADNDTDAPQVDRWGLAPIPLETVQQSYARADHWPLEDAVRLLLGLLPRTLAPETEDATTQRRVAANLDMARNCLGHSLPEAPGRRVDGAEPHVRPIDAVSWLESIGGGLPQTLADAVRQHAQRRGLSDPAGQPKTRKLLPKQIHRHRCAGIAALLWQQDPTVPVARMAQRPELKSAGCEGQAYAYKTLEQWIKSEKPGGTKPGRPAGQTFIEAHTQPKASPKPCLHINFATATDARSGRKAAGHGRNRGAGRLALETLLGGHSHSREHPPEPRSGCSFRIQDFSKVDPRRVYPYQNGTHLHILQSL